MNTLYGNLVVIVIAMCLMGGIQSKKFIGSLKSVDDDVLAEQDGKLVMVRLRGDAPRVQGLQNIWKIESPHVKTIEGKFLAVDQSAEGVKVYLARESSESAQWGIEVLRTESPRRFGSGVRGTSQSEFRLSVVAGQYKGWYLAAKELTEEQSKENVPIVLEFRVVKDPKMALTFKYVDSSFSVTSK